MRLTLKEMANIYEEETMKKLCQLEDIEEEFGIDLITFFKVMRAKKIYSKKYGYYDDFSIDIGTKDVWFDSTTKPLHIEKLCDYGKTWALTKKELENGK